jgi:hypothetical protein
MELVSYLECGHSFKRKAAGFFCMSMLILILHGSEVLPGKLQCVADQPSASFA